LGHLFPGNQSVAWTRGGKEGLMELPGIGEPLAGKIEEMLKTGRLRYLEKPKEE